MTIIKLTFIPSYNSHIISCGKSFTIDGNEWRIDDFQFFVSDIAFQDKDGGWKTAPLKTNAKQTSRVALLGQNCQQDQEVQQGSWSTTFTEKLSISSYEKVKFTLGVPFELNHLNPLTQVSPLNDSSMFWVWQTGHKFARIEFENVTDSWLFHLGSTGCKSPSVMRTPKSQCIYPNTFQFELNLNGATQVTFDLAALTAHFKLSEETYCQSEHDNDVCLKIFNNLSQSGQNSVFRTMPNE